MGKKYVIAGFVGGFIAYLWGVISWTVLPWHMNSMDQFVNESEVSEVIKLNAPRHGVYLLPSPIEKDPDMTSEEKDLLVQENHRHMQEGPFAYMVIQPHGVDPTNPTPYLLTLLSQILAALLMCYLVVRARIAKYWSRVRFVVLVALLVGVLGVLPNQLWWGVTSKITMIGFIDLVFAWGLAGLWIAKHTKPEGLPQS